MLILAVSVLVSFLLFIILRALSISAIRNLFPELRNEEYRPPSPYTIGPAQNNDWGIGYCIRKSGTPLYLQGTKSTYVVYGSLSSAMQDMNRYEQLDGVRITSLK